MAEQAIFRGATQEECQAKAAAFFQTLDPYRQPSISLPQQDATGTWYCYVSWWGLD